MKPDFGPAFAVDYSGRPAHMSSIDWAIWQRFRKAHPFTFKRLFFDVAVGDGADPGGEHTPAVLEAWSRLTRQRIDALGESSSSWTIIEMRGAAGPGAIGSLICYRDLWRSDPPDTRQLDLWLVTDVFPTNLMPSLNLAGITLFIA